VIDEILPDRVVHVRQERQLQLRAHAIGARHQHRIGEARGIQREQAAERADVGEHSRGVRALREPLDAADDFIAGIDVDAARSVIHKDR
jgi:hypothetical protein